jgi:hypothetical protein
MYPEASIKLQSPKAHVKVESKQLTRLARNSTSVFTQINEATNRGALPAPCSLAHQKTSDEKRGNPEKCKGAYSKDL